jgi:hypothetical protein
MANSNDNGDTRGLASASKATRQRVAKMGGEARGEQRRRQSQNKNSNGGR